MEDDTAMPVSTSWGIWEEALSQSSRQAENVVFKQMGAQGQSMFAASGDDGNEAWEGVTSAGQPILTFGVQDPASQPYVTGVGGTTLTTSGPGGAWASETV